MSDSTLPLAGKSMSEPETQHRPGRLNASWQALLGLALLGLVASCDEHDHGDYCFQCGPPGPQTEVSFGVVSADFNKKALPMSSRSARTSRHRRRMRPISRRTCRLRPVSSRLRH